MSIRISHDFVRRLTKGIRTRYGTEPRHTEVLNLVAEALGWKADALMHELKNEGNGADKHQIELYGLEAPEKLPTGILIDWYVRRRWREAEQLQPHSIQALEENAVDGQAMTLKLAEHALTKAAFGQVAEAADLLEGRSPDSPYSSLVFGIVKYMAAGDCPEARSMVERGISQDARLFREIAVPRKISDRVLNLNRYAVVHTQDNWWNLSEFVEHFPVGHVVAFVRDVAVQADICLVRDQESGKVSVKRNAGTGHFLEPAVPVSESVTDDFVVCLFDGQSRKMLSRHLRMTYEMSVEDYKRFWNLPDDYPMTAPGYSREKEMIASARKPS